jgi:hypothetical protein
MGLRFQEAVLKVVAEKQNKEYRFSSSAEESKGIDGYIGDIPVSIKPETYKYKKYLGEKIDAQMIFYDKKKDGLVIEYDF